MPDGREWPPYGNRLMVNDLPGDELDVDELCILSGLLSPPTQETVDALEEMARGWAWLSPAVMEIRHLGLPALRREYDRLLVTDDCPARESAWSSQVLAGGGANLERLYRQAGISLQGREPDSLAMELIYAAWYLEQDLSNAPAGWRVIWHHLSGWVPPFARCLQSHAQVELYRALGARLEMLFSERNTRH